MPFLNLQLPLSTVAIRITQQWHAPKKRKQNITDDIASTILTHPSIGNWKDVRLYISDDGYLGGTSTEMSIHDLVSCCIACTVLSVDSQEGSEIFRQIHIVVLITRTEFLKGVIGVVGAQYT